MVKRDSYMNRLIPNMWNGEIKVITGMDELISETMRTDIRLNISQDSVDYLNMHRITLKNEVLTCYQFLKEKGLLHEYHIYRDGE